MKTNIVDDQNNCNNDQNHPFQVSLFLLSKKLIKKSTQLQGWGTMWKDAFSSHFSMYSLVNVFGSQTTLEQEMKTGKLKFGNRNQSHVIAIAESKNTTHRSKLNTKFFMIPAFKILEQLFG